MNRANAIHLENPGGKSRVGDMALILVMVVILGYLIVPGQVFGQPGNNSPVNNLSRELFLEKMQISQEAEGKQTVAQEVIIEESVVQGDIKLKNITFQDKVTLKGITFSKKLLFENCVFKGEIFFENCTFKGTLSFRDCMFQRKFRLNDSITTESADFSGCEFNGLTEFYHTKFGEDSPSPITDFNNNVFREDSVFVYSKFYGSTLFSHCLFEGNANFGQPPKNEFKIFLRGWQDDNSKKAVFKGNISFDESIFERKAMFSYNEFFNASFNDVQFQGPVRFTKAKFQGYSNFNSAIFNDKADFDRAIFYDQTSTNEIDEKENNAANFYKATFRDSASFSKAVFFVHADFKRTLFKQRAFFTNTFFAKEANFNMSFFEKEFLGSNINRSFPFIRELIFYKANKATPEEFKEFYDTIVGKVGEQNGEIGSETLPSPLLGGVGAQNPGPTEVIKKWKGKEAFVDDKAFNLLVSNRLMKENSSLIFSGTHFGGEVDFRGTYFQNADFSSGEAITVFREGTNFADAHFTNLYLDGTVFLDKVYLPRLEAFFRGSGVLSNEITLDDILLPWKTDLLTNGDPLASNREDIDKKLESLSILYQQLEPLFRKNLQLAEANEMSVRAAWLSFATGKELLASFFVLLALPIKNLIFLATLFVLFFYSSILKSIFTKKMIYARTLGISFKPGKLPLLLVPSRQILDPQKEKIDIPELGVKRIEYAQSLIQKLTWPLFLCLGTFFAVFSLGNEYVTDDPRCIKKMKILRGAGFVLLPLFLYSLAKRSLGLHAIVSFF
jgi:uncharacterized protein YjbI with pentapeptide repeats